MSSLTTPTMSISLSGNNVCNFLQENEISVKNKFEAIYTIDPMILREVQFKNSVEFPKYIILKSSDPFYLTLYNVDNLKTIRLLIKDIFVVTIGNSDEDIIDKIEIESDDSVESIQVEVYIIEE